MGNHILRASSTTLAKKLISTVPHQHSQIKFLIIQAHAAHIHFKSFVAIKISVLNVLLKSNTTGWEFTKLLTQILNIFSVKLSSPLNNWMQALRQYDFDLSAVFKDGTMVSQW